MAINDDIVNILTEFGSELLKDTQTSLKARLKSANQSRLYGLLGKRNNFKVEQKGDSIHFVYELPKEADYAKYVDSGRKAGNVSREGQKSIQDWAKRHGVVESFRVKNLATRKDLQSKNKTNRPKKTLKKMPFDMASKQIAFLVARRLKSKTLKGNQFYTDTVNDGRIKELQDKLKIMIKKEVLIEVRKSL